MTGFVSNGGGHVPVGRGQQVPARLPVSPGRAKVVVASARRVPTPTRVVVQRVSRGLGVFSKKLVGGHAANCADREETVEVRQIPVTEFAVATKKTANQSARIPGRL